MHRALRALTLLLAAALLGAADARAQAPAANLGRTFNAPAAAAGADHLVVLVHGASSSPAAWADDMADDVSALFEALPDTWDVWSYDWNEDAAGPTPPSFANQTSAKVHGQHLADQILDGGYDYVHLVGHSLGGRVINTTSQILQEAGGPFSHLTFLDAYTPNVPWARTYGEYAGYAESYFSNDFWVPNTQTSFHHAFNVDVSGLDTDPNRGDFGNATDDHQWPVDWYHRTITNPQAVDLGLGFAQSKEGGGVFLGGATPVPPQFSGQRLTLTPAGSTTANVAALAKVLGPQLNPAASNPMASAQDATVLFDQDSITLTAAAGTPAWLTVSLDVSVLDDDVNSLEFDFDFLGEGPQDGVLTVFTEGVEAHQVWQRFALGVEQWSGEIILLQGLAGNDDVLDLTFRLDVASGAGSVVTIDDIHPGTAVPEPETALLLALASALVGRRARAR